MWNIFIGIILGCIGIILGCIGVLAIAITLFILIAIIDTIIKQIKKK